MTGRSQFMRAVLLWRVIAAACFILPRAYGLECAGITVIPHGPTVATQMRYGAPRGPTDGARVQVFIRNAAFEQATLAADTAITVPSVPMIGETPAFPLLE